MGLGVGVAVGLGVGLGVGVAVGLGVGVAVGLGVGVAVGLGVGANVGVGLGSAVAGSVEASAALGVADGALERTSAVTSASGVSIAAVLPESVAALFCDPLHEEHIEMKKTASTVAKAAATRLLTLYSLPNSGT